MFVSIQSNIQTVCGKDSDLFVCTDFKNHQNLLYFIAKSNKSKNKEIEI